MNMNVFNKEKCSILLFIYQGTILIYSNFMNDVSFQNIMTFNKCTINGKSYGDHVDKYGNPIDITDVSAL